MNENIAKIQKNMVTVFEGYVNDQKFDSREAMNLYIGQCISEGKPISNISYSTTSKYIPAEGKRPSEGLRKIEEKQNEISWMKMVEKLNTKVPQPYENVIAYITPFVTENVMVNEDNSAAIMEDFKQKLNRRMHFLENEVFSRIRTWKYDTKQVDQWLEKLQLSLKHKLEWSNRRIETIEDFLNKLPESDNDFTNFIRNQVNITYLETFYNLYGEVAGFCSALIDIVQEVRKANKA